MIRSLYSGVSGMRNHQTRMDTIGNNIANVNTTGFKSSRVNFQDALSQKIKSGGNSTNPAFVGTGVNMASISTNFNNGPLQNTGRILDLAIQGNGFFMVSDGTNDYYTRDGVFFIDQGGNIVNSDGYTLDGTTAIGTPGNIATINIAPDGAISGTYTGGGTFNAGTINLYGFANNEGLTKVGKNLFQEETAISGAATAVAAGSVNIASGYLEMSNVDLSEEFTNMITTQRGYQANARTITVSDTLLQELIDLKR